MGLLDRIKSVFTRERIPDETKLLLNGVDDVAALRRGLDEVITRNEVERKEVERECEKLAEIEIAEKDRLRAGLVNEREKLNALRYVKRVQRRIESFEKRQKIHEENIDLHQVLLDRIDEMEAMELKAIREDQIQEIAVDYEERLEKHKEIVSAGRLVREGERDYDDVRERRELEALEREIMGPEASKEPAPKTGEPKVTEPKGVEPKASEPRRVPIEQAIKESTQEVEDTSDVDVVGDESVEGERGPSERRLETE